MPTFTIETPDGRHLDIEAATQQAAIAGAQDWVSKNPKPASGNFWFNAPPGVPAPQPHQQNQQPPDNGGFWGQALRGAAEGVQGIGDMAAKALPSLQPQAILGGAANATDKLGALIQTAISGQAPTQPPGGNWITGGQTPNPLSAGAAAGIKAASGVAIPMELAKPPASTPQKYARAIAQFVAASGMAGGSNQGLIATLGRIGGGAASGAASQAASDLAQKIAPNQTVMGVPVSQIAANVAPVLTGALVGDPLGGPPGMLKQLAERTSPMSGADQAAVTARMQSAKDIGFPITGPEATDTVTGTSKLAGLQRDIEGRPAGIEKLNPMMAQRPAQAQAIMADVLSKLGPELPAPAVSQGAQDAAQGVISAAESARTAATAPAYAAADAQPVNPQRLADVLGNMDATISADKSGELTGPLSDFRDALGKVLKATDGQPTVGDLSPLAQKYAEKADLPLRSGGLTAREGGALGSAVGDLKDILAPLRIPNQQFAAISQQHINPLYGGPIGAIARPFTGAGEPSLPSQARALYPSTPYPGQPTLTGQAVSAMGQPGADLTRAYLGQQAAEQLGDVQTGGANTFGPGKLATVLGGNPLQKETLLAGVGAASPSAQQQLAQGLSAFEASRARLQTGSPTVEKLETATENTGAHALIAEGLGATKRLTVDRAFNFFQDLGIKMNQDKLAAAMSADPQGWANVMQAVEKARPNTPQARMAQQAAVAFVAANSGRQTQ